MGKLLKYELIRSKLFIMILMFLIVGVEGLYLFGYFTDNTEVIEVAVGLLALTAVYGFVAVYIHAIQNYYNDLKNRYGYMLFLTPRNGFQIIGSKLCQCLLILLTGGLLIGLFGGLDLYLSFTNSEDAIGITLYAEALMEEFDWTMLLFLLEGFLTLLGTLLTIYFAITLAFTFFNGKRGKGFLCFLVYLGIDLVVNGITDAIMAPMEESFYVAMETMETSSYLEMIANGGLLYILLSIGIHLLIAVGMYIGTSLLIDKKLSL